MSRNCTCEAMVAIVGQTQRKLSILKKGTGVYILHRIEGLLALEFEHSLGFEPASLTSNSEIITIAPRWAINVDYFFRGRPSTKWFFSNLKLANCDFFGLEKFHGSPFNNLIFWDGSINVILSFLAEVFWILKNLIIWAARRDAGAESFFFTTLMAFNFKA